MGKVDCNITINFINERTRMCSQTNCETCETIEQEIDCLVIDQKFIDFVQSWSDEHPRKTYAQRTWS